MRTIRFKSCQIGSSISLDKMATFFRMPRTSSWKEYIVLNGQQLEEVLKKQCGSMHAYLFEFGCITFVDFDEADIQTFLEFFAGMVESIDYSMVARYAETHLIEVVNQSEFKPWPGSSSTYDFEEAVIPLTSIILAKSTALNKIESDVNANIDESETYIDYLKRGRLRINKKALTTMISKFLKFEYESMNGIRIFDRSVAANNSLNGRGLYDELAEYYELYDRFDVLQSKIGSLRSTMKSYNSLSYRQIENRLYILEIFLLGLFPVVSLIRMFMHS
jgi:required for meiotic nuclear division protein 1